MANPQPAPGHSPADPGIHSRTVPLIVAAAFFMETLDGSVINTALPAIAAGFGVAPLDMSLSITAYLVALAICIPAAGWVAERFGGRRVFAGAIAVFTFASLLCALAPNQWAFVAARVLQGVAAAFMSPVGRLVVLNETPPNRVIEAIATITWPGLIGPVVGPPLGGLIVTYASWHWIFLLNVPLGMAGVWLVLRHVPQRELAPPRRFDLPGFLLTGAALALVIEGLARFGEQRGAGWHAGAAVLVGLAFGIAAVWHAGRSAHPLLNLRVLRVRSFAFATATAGFAMRMAISASPFLIPLMFQVGFGLSALNAGFMVLVYMLGNLAMKSVTTVVLRRFGFRNVLLYNGVLSALALAACGLLTAGTALPIAYLALFVAGMTRSMTFTCLTALAFADVAPQQRAGATALSAMLWQVSMTLGVALAAFALSASQQAREAAAPSAADFRHVWLVLAVINLLATAAALRLPRDVGASVASTPRGG
jgi:EmrB/QacA subfamily drug resistance transporter